MKNKLFIIVAALLTVQGCKPSVQSDIFIRDLYDVVATKKPIAVPVIIGMDIQNAKKCDEAKNKILPILSKYTSDLKFIECKDIKNSVTDKMFVETKMQIVIANEKGQINYSNLFAILVSENPFGVKDAFMLYALKSSNVKKLEKELDKMFSFQKVNIDSVDLKLKINNDTRDNVELRVGGAFVNGKPIAYGSPFLLSRRQFLDITPSDARSSYLMTNGYVPLGIVAKEGKKLPDFWRRIPALGGTMPWDGK